MLTFNRAAEAITALPAPTRSAGRAVDSAAAARAVPGPVRAAAPRRPRAQRHEYGYRPLGRPPDRGRDDQRAADHAARRERVPVHVPGRHGAEEADREARVQQRLAAVGEMAAGIAHEIRNPLASMAGSIQILRDELPLTPDQSQLMDIVLRESDRLNDTIRSFLAFAKPQRIGGRGPRRPADPHRHGAPAREQRRGDRRPLDRRGRAGRAGRSTAPTKRRSGRSSGTWRPTACGRCRPAGSCGSRCATTPADGRAAPKWSSACDDEGVGIAPEDIDGIFQPFRGGFANGTGLGLSIVHRIASDYGGEVRVASQQGKGTSVEVVLPIGKDRYRVPVGGRRRPAEGRLTWPSP